MGGEEGEGKAGFSMEQASDIDQGTEGMGDCRRPVLPS